MVRNYNIEQNEFSVGIDNYDANIKGRIYVTESEHSTDRSFERSNVFGIIKLILTMVLRSVDIWDLLPSIVDAEVFHKHYCRHEVYDFTKKRIFLQTPMGSVIVVGRIETSRYKQDVEVSGWMKVVTFIGEDMLDNFAYYDKDVGLVFNDNDTIPMISQCGELVSLEDVA